MYFNVEAVNNWIKIKFISTYCFVTAEETLSVFTSDTDFFLLLKDGGWYSAFLLAYSLDCSSSFISESSSLSVGALMSSDVSTLYHYNHLLVGGSEEVAKP